MSKSRANFGWDSARPDLGLSSWSQCCAQCTHVNTIYGEAAEIPGETFQRLLTQKRYRTAPLRATLHAKLSEKTQLNQECKMTLHLMTGEKA